MTQGSRELRISHAPEPIRRLAERLSQAQGCKVRLTREAKGYQIYLPCPTCIEEKGKKELNDPKYAINASMYCGYGDQFSHLKDDDPGERYNPTRHQINDERATTRDRRSGVCMRTVQSARPHFFSVSELLSMATITERHPDIHSRAEVSGGGSDNREDNWVTDEASGILCPPPPGKVTPIIELPEDSAAIWYLKSRGFDPQKLWEQFRCSWCYEEWPEKKNNVFYRKMPGGWKDTGQGRIIFYGLHKGAPLVWQGRYPEWTTEDGLNKYALNPYTMQWDHVATRAAGHQSWFPVSPFDQVNETGSLKWQPSKYRTAPHGYRELMGWDAAVAAPDYQGFRYCVLTEGPMDAARVGPGGIAIIGKSLSPERAAKVAA